MHRDHSPAALLYTPAGQGAHDAPTTLYCPAAHSAVATVAAPLQFAPAGHTSHCAPPAMLYLPGGHGMGVDDVAPAGQYDPGPATHTPLHDAVVKPDVLPNVEAGHRPEHSAVGSPAVVPYRPSGQGVHADEPARENCPAEHRPEHVALGSPVTAPSRPASHFVHAVELTTAGHTK